MEPEPLNDAEEQHEPFLHELWHAVQGVVVLGMAVGFAAHVVSMAMLAGNKQAGALAPSGIIVTTPPIAPGDPIIDVILVCIVTGIVVYLLLVAVCQSEWVKKKTKIKDCFRKRKWYNPFDWVRILVCVVKWVVRRVLQKICSWKEVLVIVLTVACIIAGLVLLA
jgi:hypothetical protein